MRSEKLGEVAAEFEQIHNIERAREVGSVHTIIPAAQLRPYLIEAVERGMAKSGGSRRGARGLSLKPGPADGCRRDRVPAAGVPRDAVAAWPNRG